MSDFKTKADIDTEIKRLKEIRETLPEEATRQITEGWIFRGGLLKRWDSRRVWAVYLWEIVKR